MTPTPKPPPPPPSPPPALTLTDEQQQLVDLVAGPRPPRIVCLTGGPGCGKTTTIRGLVERLTEQGRTLRLSAPSGKAAQRLAEATGRRAATIHRMLYLKPRSELAEPVRADVVVADEASMIDAKLMGTLAQSCFWGGGVVRTLLLVGDADQLPPVGPGQPFHDLLAHGDVAKVRLTQVHRQAAESGIVRAAYAIRDGHLPEWAPDFQLVEAEDASEVAPAVWELVNDLELDPDTSQILSPQSTYAAGHKAINAFVEQQRERCGATSPLVRGLFREGTKVINTKNDYSRPVFNGETGWVLEAQEGDKPSRDRVVVEIAGEAHEFKGGAIKQLLPAWAYSIHRSQGSEADDVVFVCHKQHTRMLTRSLAYVAVTRARQRVFVVGTKAALAIAVRQTRDTRRRTNLALWLGQGRGAA